MKTKVSVIIPVYNAEEFLADCLESVLNQSLNEIEIILVNDGSTDSSISIIRRYQAKDSRIVVIDKENEGAGLSRNRGIKEASGEYIAFMDADDFYPSNDVLEKLYSTAKREDVKIVGGKRVRLMEDQSLSYDPDVIEVFGERIYASGRTDYTDYQYDYGYQHFIYSRFLLIDHNIVFPNFKRFQDPPFFVKAMIAAKCFYFVDYYTYGYRRTFQDEFTQIKWTLPKTIDMISGMIDNLVIAKDNSLAKLYYITVNRLNSEGSYVAIKNLNDSNINELLSVLIKANSMIDIKWLKENGYELPDPFVLDVFKYAVDTAKKYEDLRNKKILKPIRKILGK